MKVLNSSLQEYNLPPTKRPYINLNKQEAGQWNVFKFLRMNKECTD